MQIPEKEDAHFDETAVEEVLKQSEFEGFRLINIKPDELEQTDRRTYLFTKDGRDIMFSLMPNGFREDKKEQIRRGLRENIPLM
jgi:hypothetical protein